MNLVRTRDRVGTAGMTSHPVQCGAEVCAALENGVPIVALESTIIAHGLPRPENAVLAREFEDIVRAAGACPATIAVIDGVARVGLAPGDLDRIASGDGVRKLGMRDLPTVVAERQTGATTVSATAFLAARVGIRVFATGGIGGVHRGWASSLDESADLSVLATERVTVVCAGVKSILDVPATLERLETLGVTVVGYRTDDFPGFYLRSSGLPVTWRAEDPTEIAAIMREQDALGTSTSLLVANPVSSAEQLDPYLHDAVLGRALAVAADAGIEGQTVTPFLLDYLQRETGGASLRANVAAVRGNVRLASEVAISFADRDFRTSGHDAGALV